MKSVLVLLVLCTSAFSSGQSDDCTDCGEGNYCDGAAPACNQCVSSCVSTCTQPSCGSYCVRRCPPCRSYRTGGCSRTSDSPSKSVNEVKVASNPVVNISNTIDITNRIDNVNHINIPVDVNSTNVNNIVVKVEPKPSQQTAKVTDNSTTTTTSPSCCMVIPPKQCQYEAGDLNCRQNPYKLCSDTCRTPIVAPHPVPVPVYVPRPYPVPQPVIKHVPVTQYVHVPVSQPVPVPVPQPIPVPQPVPIPQPQPVYVRQQTCPTAWYGGNYVPTCSNIRDTRQFVGTSQQFLIDQLPVQGVPTSQCSFVNRPPWLQCGASQMEDCGACTFCNGQYNPEMCISSPQCSPSCRRLLQSTNLHANLKSQLQCSTFSDGRVQCL